MKNLQRTSLIMLAILSLTTLVYAQQQRASPAESVSAEVNGTQITVKYGSPAVKGRTIWGGLEPYDKVWRTGANEATTIEFSKDVRIDGKTVKAGKYALFTIPREGDWTVIINSVANQWGAYGYDESKDVLRFDVSPAKNDMTERLKFTINDQGSVSMAWDKLKISFDVK